MKPNFDVHQKHLSVAFLGAFNPLNFTPDWLHKYELISDKDFEEAKIQQLNIDGIQVQFTWFKIEVTPVSFNTADKRLMVTLIDEGSYTIFKDLVYSLIEMHITTSAYAVGINSTYTITNKSREDWDALGHKLVPKEHWRNVFSPNQKDEDSKLGITHVSMRLDSHKESVVDLPEGLYTELNVTVRPVIKSETQKLDFATSINFNYHFPIPDRSVSITCSAMDLARKTLDIHWDTLKEEADVKLNELASV
ncbi:hypothetical protein NM22_16880 [Vibrio tubiashii]|nr:hypothetical protein NM22_16880 [Vibrio tubiashii]